VGGVKMSGAVEGDFNTGDGNALTSNSRHFRLRLAYARADHPSGFFLLAGQYTTLSNNEDIGFLGKYAANDVNGPTGSRNGARQPQLRVGWKTPLGPGQNLTLEAGIEKHSVANLGSASVAEDQGEGQTTPLFGGRVTFNHPVVRIQAGAVVANNTVILTGGSDESDGAWMVFGSTEIMFPPVTLFANLYTQKGLGRLLGGAGDFATAFLVSSKVENVESDGFAAGVKFQLTPQTQIDAIYGWQKADSNPGFAVTALETLRTMEINIKHSFWKSWRAAFAVMRNDVEAFNGTDGDNTMVATFLQYFF
jgi:hypothetical protein